MGLKSIGCFPVWINEEGSGPCIMVSFPLVRFTPTESIAQLYND